MAPEQHSLVSSQIRIALSDQLAVWKQLHGRRILITGATGFFGNWLLRSFKAANDHFGIHIFVAALSRDPSAFLKANPDLRELTWLRFVRGNLGAKDWLELSITDIIHAASPVHCDLAPDEVLFQIADGTRSLLSVVRESGVRRILYISSGAVYGPDGLSPDGRIAESSRSAPDLLSPSSAYAEGKRVSEWLLHTHAVHSGTELKIARCFSFCGPMLPLDARYAIVDFIQSALKRRALRIQGDGSAVRSYMYPTDLVNWLICVLVNGGNRQAYNVGSDVPVTISQLAQLIVRVSGLELPIEILGRPSTGLAPNSYVPSTDLAKTTLGCCMRVDLKESAEHTYNWIKGLSYE